MLGITLLAVSRNTSVGCVLDDTVIFCEAGDSEQLPMGTSVTVIDALPVALRSR